MNNRSQIVIVCLRMYSILTILISIINHGTIIHANKHQIQVRYFVNKEIVDKIEQIEKNILPQTEGTINEINLLIQNVSN